MFPTAFLIFGLIFLPVFRHASDSYRIFLSQIAAAEAAAAAEQAAADEAYMLANGGGGD
jgi:ABC-type transport system involved in cytochrome c biogenesis permease subunit